MRRHYGLAAAAHNLTPSQTAYVARTPQRPTLRFSENGDEAVEIDYRTHWVSGALDDRKRERLVEKANRLPELVVMRPLNSDWTCHRCGGGGDGGLLIMEHPGPACLPRVGLGELLFLPAGDAALTRRAAEEFEIGRRRPLQPEPRPATNARAARGTRCPGAELVGGALRFWTGSPPRWRLPHEGGRVRLDRSHIKYQGLRMMIAKRLSLLARLLIAGVPLALAAAPTAANADAPATIIAAGAPDATPHTQPIVVTPAGTIAGLRIGKMDAYRGIPYAAPPVGPLRWEPPQAPTPWSGTLEATQFANHCPQNASYSGIASTTEDCLYLNVFVPRNTSPNANLPVMVWFHGGGFNVGESDDYDPDKWVAHGRIVVTLNYRLGFLGFLATSGLSKEPHAQVNYGIMDQRAALQWVQTNISAFGGDPKNTTILGQSAGGASVVTHLVSPGSAGLFQNALIESGSYVFLTVQTLKTALANGKTFATDEGCAPSDTACLRALSVENILAEPSPGGVTAIAGGLTIDGQILPQAPLDAVLAQQYTHVPILQGTNHDEFRLFTAELFDLSGGPLTAAEYPFFVQATLDEVGLGKYANKVLAKYPLSNYASPDLAISALATDAAFATTAVVSDDLLALGTPVYAYEFADEHCPDDFLPPVSFPYGAAHEFELPFLGDSFTRTLLPLKPAERRLSATMIDYWTQFSGTGSPNNTNTPLWLPSVPEVGDVNELVPSGPYMSTKFQAFHKTAFWMDIAGLGGLDLQPAHGGAPAPLPAGIHPRLVTLDAFEKAARKIRPRAN